MRRAALSRAAVAALVTNATAAALAATAPGVSLGDAAEYFAKALRLVRGVPREELERAPHFGTYLAALDAARAALGAKTKAFAASLGGPGR